MVLVLAAAIPADQSAKPKGEDSNTAARADKIPPPPIISSGNPPESVIEHAACDEAKAEKQPSGCVDWEGVRAAEQQVYWAARSYNAGLVGIALVVATFLATFWAAIAAWRAARVAEKALTDLERPHVFVVVNPSLNVTSTGGHERAGVVYNFANYGRFPATIRACHCFLGASEDIPRKGGLSKQITTFIGPDKTVEGKKEWLSDEHPIRFEMDDNGEADGATIIPEAETETFFRIDVNYTGLGDMEYVSTFIWRWDCERNCWFSVESHRT